MSEKERAVDQMDCSGGPYPACRPSGRHACTNAPGSSSLIGAVERNRALEGAVERSSPGSRVYLCSPPT